MPQEGIGDNAASVSLYKMYRIILKFLFFILMRDFMLKVYILYIKRIKSLDDVRRY